MDNDIKKALDSIEKAVQHYIETNDDALECSSLYGSFTIVKLALEQFCYLGELSKDSYGIPIRPNVSRNEDDSDAV